MPFSALVLVSHFIWYIVWALWCRQWWHRINDESLRPYVLLVTSNFWSNRFVTTSHKHPEISHSRMTIFLIQTTKWNSLCCLFLLNMNPAIQSQLCRTTLTLTRSCQLQLAWANPQSHHKSIRKTSRVSQGSSKPHLDLQFFVMTNMCPAVTNG